MKKIPIFFKKIMEKLIKIKNKNNSGKTIKLKKKSEFYIKIFEKIYKKKSDLN